MTKTISIQKVKMNIMKQTKMTLMHKLDMDAVLQ